MYVYMLCIFFVWSMCICVYAMHILLCSVYGYVYAMCYFWVEVFWLMLLYGVYVCIHVVWSVCAMCMLLYGVYVCAMCYFWVQFF